MQICSRNLGMACGLVSLVAMAIIATSAEVHAVDDAGETVRLSSLDLSRMALGWGDAKPDRSIGGKPLSMRGKAYDHGLGTHAPSRLRIQLNGQAVRFRSIVGLDDTAEGHGRVRFLVLADHRIVWDSGEIWGSTPARPVELDVRDVKVLELRVEDGGDGSGYDHADWAEATLVMQPDAPAPTTLEPYEVLSVAGTSFPLRFLVGDDGTLYQLPLGARREDFRHESSDLAYPQGGYGFVFEPALQVVHADGNRSTLLKYVTSHRESQTDGAELLRIHLHDAVFPLEVMLCFRAYPQWGLVEQWVEITHHEASAITLERMASASLLLPADRLELLHFHGDWNDEMHPVAERLTHGIKIIDSKLGVRAHQFTLPSFVLSLDGKPSETEGRVLAGSLAWSGSFQVALEHTGRRVRALCGVNPFSSAYHLEPDVTLVTPATIWVWSQSGLGDMSRRFHAWARAHGIRDGHQPRATLLNNWEATGFDFNYDRIVRLLAPAKEIGVELFLLDDGWFGNKYPRVNDQAGLGDWEPNRARFPDGLAPLARAARQCGLRFGIWIEPEMVNPKSELFEQHPEWAIQQPERELQLQRNQLILDITRPEVREHEWNVIETTLGVPGVSYAKWDANRYVTQPGSTYLDAEHQTHLWIDYTRYLYELMLRTAQTFPSIELMLCSGGGGRVDYGALRYFHEFWPSDNTDALRRVMMQWDYSYFFPPIAICSHVTHAGNRPLHFATCVAMSARFGMDIDVTALSAEDRAICQSAIETYKRIREVVHLGDLYRVERPHDAARGVQNYVSADRSRVVVFVFQLRDGTPDPVKPQGLNAQRQYRITEIHCAEGRTPLADEGKTIRGAEIMQRGICPSVATALQATLIELTAVN